MKKFEAPIVEIAKFEIADIITVSGGTGADGEFGGMGQED